MGQTGDVNIKIFGLSDTGIVRAQNQDSFLVGDLSAGKVLTDFSTRRVIKEKRTVIDLKLGSKGSLLAVADGMGGAAAGDLASMLGVDTLFSELLKGLGNGTRTNLTIPEMLKVGVERSNLRLWEESQMNIEYRGMGTTLTAALLHEKTAYIAEVGDSRAYLIRADQIEQLTKDQSAVQMLIDLGRLTKEQAATAPNRNIILQALGVEPSVQVALTKLELRKGDILLLCSDGLSNKVADEELRDLLLNTKSLDEGCRNLVELANMRGGEDNITLVVASVDGDLPAPVSNEPIWRTVEILSIFFPNEGRRGMHTSQFPRLSIEAARKAMQIDEDDEDDE